MKRETWVLGLLASLLSITTASAQSEGEFRRLTLKEFRDNKRSGADTQMSAAIFGASDADIAALAHYAASR